jgi:hypothetical protein
MIKKKGLSKEVKERIREIYEFYKHLAYPHTEEFIKILLDNNGLVEGRDYIRDYRPFKNTKIEVDFAFVKDKLAIEIQGDYWHNLLPTIERDIEKKELLTKFGWKLICVWEHEINEALYELSTKKKRDWSKVDGKKYIDFSDTRLSKKLINILLFYDKN